MKFQLFYTDFPWKHNARRNPSKFGSGSEGQYPTMNAEEIEIYLRQLRLMEDPEGSIWHMWVAALWIPRAFDIFRRCGLVYHSPGFVWKKLSRNGNEKNFPGCTFAQNCEYSYVFRSGKKFHWPAKPLVSNFLEAPIREHSRKPDEFRTRLEMLYPNLSKVEVFARQTFPGWHSIGNEIHKFDEE